MYFFTLCSNSLAYEHNRNRMFRFSHISCYYSYYQLFVENLAGAALNWFSWLEANTIKRFYNEPDESLY